METLRKGLLRVLHGKRGALFEAALAQQRACPDFGQPMERSSFVETLRRLVRCEPASEAELAELEAKLFALGERVRASVFDIDIPEVFWHFISDADIRFKDPHYASSQQNELLEWISTLKVLHAT